MKKENENTKISLSKTRTLKSIYNHIPKDSLSRREAVKWVKC